jgi:hypothetical protein
VLERKIKRKNKNTEYYCTKKEKIISDKFNHQGYKVVLLWKDNISKGFLVHRLIALTFIENPNNYPIVNHKDEIKSNNCVNNLEWCTNSYNVLYSKNFKNSVEKCKKAIDQYDLEFNYIRSFDSIIEATKFLGKNKSTPIILCLKHKNNARTAFGYVWTYSGEEPDKEYVKGRRNNKPIEQYDLDGNLINVFSCRAEVDKYLGKIASGVSNCCNGKGKTAYGYKWKYKE